MKAEVLFNEARAEQDSPRHTIVLLRPESKEDSETLRLLVEHHMLGKWSEEKDGTAYVLPDLMSFGFF